MGNNNPDDVAEGESIKRLLERLDGALDKDPNPLQPKKLSSMQTAPDSLARQNGRDGAAKPKPKPKLQLVSSSLDHQGYLDHQGHTVPIVARQQARWYHRNASVALVAISVSLAICSPLVVLLGIHLRNKSRASAASVAKPGENSLHLLNSGIIHRAEKDVLTNRKLNDRKRRAMEVLQAGISTSVARPQLVAQPQLARRKMTVATLPDNEANGRNASGIPETSGMSNRNPPKTGQAGTPGKTPEPPRIVAKSELSGRVGEKVSLSARIKSAEGLPQGAVVMVSGLPDAVVVSDAVKRGAGIWIVDAGAISNSVLDLRGAKAGKYNLIMDLFGPDGDPLSQVGSLLTIRKRKSEPPVPGVIATKRKDSKSIVASLSSVPVIRKVPTLSVPPARLGATNLAGKQRNPDPPVAGQSMASTGPVARQYNARKGSPERNRKLPAVARIAPEKDQQSDLPGDRIERRSMAPRQVLQLIKRGRKRMAMGDIALARLLFERAARAGSAVAAFALAESYDPNYIQQLGVIGIRGNAVMARHWYLNAQKLDSSTQIDERLESLPDP